MKVRNNTGGDYSLVFTDGHSLNFSRAEISRELTDEESTDPKFVKALSGKYKHIVLYKEPIKEEPKKKEEPKEEKKTIIIKKEDIEKDKPRDRERRKAVKKKSTPKARKED